MQHLKSPLLIYCNVAKYVGKINSKLVLIILNISNGSNTPNWIPDPSLLNIISSLLKKYIIMLPLSASIVPIVLCYCSSSRFLCSLLFKAAPKLKKSCTIAKYVDWKNRLVWWHNSYFFYADSSCKKYLKSPPQKKSGLWAEIHKLYSMYLLSS